MEQNNQVQLATQWLDITIERFVANIRRLKVVDTGALAGSFQKQVIGAADGDVLKMRLSYALWGMFQDMGVGRGMGAGVRKGDDGYDRIRNSRGKLKRHTRKARAWYSKEAYAQTKRLSELMLELKGQVLLTTITSLPTQTTVNL
ncbi:hypothetical protein MUN82_06535 [Hymenobacter aerilatus]|uniref:Uncharacterized protein n=1 Tax=Hymenobacter aerilatus TaxID=2932251 RepID=A0A8T9SWZ9_9BACT|nr:hypothetical protein [Hymenobacter aerilatus]UOR06752.1 hypothetical protein MUN82_06535 [Hymenobacter aerilatus]